MDCHDAHERFSALLDGELGLTEWTDTEALVSWATSQAAAPSTRPAPSQWPRENPTAGRRDISPSPGPSGAVDGLPAPRTVMPSASPPAMPPAPSTPRQGSTASA